MSNFFMSKVFKYTSTLFVITGLVALVSCSDVPAPTAPKYNTNISGEEALKASAMKKIFLTNTKLIEITTKLALLK